MQLWVRHALRVRHGVVHSEHSAVQHCPLGCAHAHVGKSRVDALELPDKIDVFVVDDQARTSECILAEIGLGRGAGVGLV